MAFLARAVSVAVFVAPFTITEEWSWRVPLPPDPWVGTWTGVEGLRIDIEKAGAGYKLHNVNMDGESDFTGVPDGDKIVFERAGKSETLTH